MKSWRPPFCFYEKQSHFVASRNPDDDRGDRPGDWHQGDRDNRPDGWHQGDCDDRPDDWHQGDCDGVLS